jgi:DNA modification methylase
MALRIKQLDPAKLTPYPNNARTHSAKQVTQIAASITEFGFLNPVLIDGEGGIIAGHGRVMAAVELGLAQVPTINANHLTDDQRRAYIIADNKLAENAGWDQGILIDELDALLLDDFDLALVGFDHGELAVLLNKEDGKTNPDELPPEPDDPVTELGDIWLLGKHRLICGDSCNEADVMAVLDGTEPHLMVTDPPYGVEYDSTWRDNVEATRSKQVAVGKVENDDQADWTEAWLLFPGDVAYVWHASCFPEAQLSLLKAQFEIRSQIIWVKQGFVFGRGHYHWQHEPCWYAVRKGGTGHWAGDRKQTTTWEINNANLMKGGERDDATTGHGTQKPVECMKRPMLNNSEHGDLVYDPFLGSGTTLIAAEQVGRTCLGVELNPAYVDMAVQRWQNFTGEVATLADTGASFDSTGAERCKAGA